MADEAKQYLLASRLVALTKPDSDSLRPIAVGELFYPPGCGHRSQPHRASPLPLSCWLLTSWESAWPSGAERIVHCMQYSLTDRTAKRAALKVDMSECAFNSVRPRARCCASCTPRPSSARCSASRTSPTRRPPPLLLPRCSGQSIQSGNGVRQGDPLACLLFCVYMRELYAELAAAGRRQAVRASSTTCTSSGSPAEVVKALAALQRLLPAVSLRCKHGQVLPGLLPRRLCSPACLPPPHAG